MPGTPRPTRLPLAFRVGITGTRTLAPEAEPLVRQAVAAALAAVHGHVQRLANEDWARDVYLTGPDGHVVPTLRFLSPLAEGADRLAAEEAIKLGYVL